MSFYVRRNGSAPALHELKHQLQTSDLKKKAELMEELLTFYRNADDTERALMSVIKYVSGYSKDHTLAKLTNLFWECLPSQNSSLTLLISQIVRNELQSSNEYMRGACLRNLSKTGNLDILKTVDEVIAENLNHPHPYVRRNACLCVASMASRYSGFFEDTVDTLIHIAVEDSDRSCQQHAINALGILNLPKAYKTFIVDRYRRNDAPNPEVFVCAIIELTRFCWMQTNKFPPPVELVELVEREVLLNELMYILDNTSSNMVRLSAVTCILWMSSRPDHLSAAAQACLTILTTNTNLDVKYHVIDLVEKISSLQGDVIETIALDILRLAGSGTGLPSPPLQLAEKIARLAIPNITSNQVKPAVEVLQAHLMKLPQKNEMQNMLLKGMRQLCTRFPPVAVSVIDLLLNYLAECESIEVTALLRELIVCSSIDATVQESIILRLIESIVDVHEPSVLCQGLYLIGQFAQTPETKIKFVESLYHALEPLPLPPSVDAGGEPTGTSGGSKIVVKTVVLPDGSYGTQNVLVDEDQKQYGLRECILSNQSTNLLTVTGMAICKVLLRESNIAGREMSQAEAILILSSLYKYLKETPVLGGGDSSCKKRLEQYRRNRRISKVSGGSEFFDAVVGERIIREGEDKTSGESTECETPISVHEEVNFFPKYSGLTDLKPFEPAALQAESSVVTRMSCNGVLLSGLSDPVYIEAYIRLNHLDVVIEFVLMNLTNEMLTNVDINLCTNDVILEKQPEYVNLKDDIQTITYTLRLSGGSSSSSSSGVCSGGGIFGYCIYNLGVQKHQFPLSDIHIDILDCLEQSYIGNQSFRKLWSQFEWENKIPINLHIQDENRFDLSDKCLKFLDMLTEKTKMRATAENEDLDIKTMAENGMVAVNFCTRSIFNEDALINMSLEIQQPNKITGTARIRSRTQGIALSLGDRIAQTQRVFSSS